MSLIIPISIQQFHMTFVFALWWWSHYSFYAWYSTYINLLTSINLCLTILHYQWISLPTNIRPVTIWWNIHFTMFNGLNYLHIILCLHLLLPMLHISYFLLNITVIMYLYRWCLFCVNSAMCFLLNIFSKYFNAYGNFAHVIMF